MRSTQLRSTSYCRGNGLLKFEDDWYWRAFPPTNVIIRVDLLGIEMTDIKALSEAKLLGLMADFENEPPLHTQLPVQLVNGKSVPLVHVVCSMCGGTISGDRVHGRVIQSLPHVVTVSANGHCEPCNRMTHADCRFRAQASETVIEWLGSNGCWQVRELRQPTLAETIARAGHRLVAWFSTML